MNAVMPQAGFWTVEEAAAELGLTVRGIRDRLERGLMAGIKMGARFWMIPDAEVQRWRELGRQRPGRKPKDAPPT